MRAETRIATMMALFSVLVSGCSETPTAIPPQSSAVEDSATLEKAKQDRLKQLNGTWLLKSRTVSGHLGSYSLMSADSPEYRYRIDNGEMELQIADGPWSKYASLSIGNDAQILLITKTDVSGQKRVIQTRYLLEGQSLTIVQDNQFPDVVPDSLDMEAGHDRQRQKNVYSRIPSESNR